METPGMLLYSVRWVANVLSEVDAQQRANRIKKRKLRALRKAKRAAENELLILRDIIGRNNLKKP